MPWPARRVRFGAGVLLLVVLAACPLAGRPRNDPKPPMRWDDLLACRLVVLASYEGHGDGVLTLRLRRVLKGRAAPGDTLAVRLEHLYSVEAAPAGQKEPDGGPRLCFRRQSMTPGTMKPVPVGPDVREPTLYFFPEARRPALVRRGQVRYGLFAEAWGEVLDGRPADPVFLTMQTADPQRSWDAADDLARRREADALDRLVRWTIDEPLPRHCDEVAGFGARLAGPPPRCTGPAGKESR